jgi:ribosomal protein S18 acetylase RimI-like enzyme
MTIRDVAPADRERLDGVLQESFTGIYLRHARKTLSEVPVVRAIFTGDSAIGLSMLKTLEEGPGYVYYIAVSSSSRRKGIGKRLLLDALKLFTSMGSKEVYASVGAENLESNALFRGQGFRKTDYSEVAHKYGVIKAITMYRAMYVVPGEHLLVKDNLTMSDF